MKTLILAEKPSVAKDIVRALSSVAGRFNEHEDHHENEKYIVTSAVGHLLEIFVNEQSDPKKGRWSLKSLPVIPPKFDIKPIDKTKKRLIAVSRLMQRKDVDVLVNACDAGREGELIFRLIVQFAGEKKPLDKTIKRLWLQSLTPQAILSGIDNMRSDLQMKGLEDAARCRSEADWIVGINGTRALTAFNSMNGGFSLTTMGRVQTPTLSLIVERETKIITHRPVLYAELTADFQAKAGPYKGKFFDRDWKKTEDPDRKADRLAVPDAVKIAEAIKGKQAVITFEESKTQTQASPFLFDLTSLQREANSRFGMSAKNTLSVAQALYEKHKVLTYPRTDARCLPEDYVPVAKKTIETFAKESYKDLGQFANIAIDKNYVWPNKKIFNNAKISDHFAIIPTGMIPRGLDEYESRIFDLVAKRFLAVFFPAAEFHVVTRFTGVDKYQFKSEGKVLKVPGWLAIYGKESVGDDESPILVDVGKDEKVDVIGSVVEENYTRPAPRFNEATLLGSMESAGKVVEDEEAKGAMKDKGLGTPATRAAIIEGLLSEEYAYRSGKELVPTPKAFQLVTLLKGLDVNDFTSPELTGEWEFKLSQMEAGKISREAFMSEIATLITTLVEKAKASSPNTLKGDGSILDATCPKCGKEKSLIGAYRTFRCNEECGFQIPRYMMGRNLSNVELSTVLIEKRIGPLQGFRTRMGKEFASVIVLRYDEVVGTFVLSPEFQERDPAPDSIDLSDKEPIAKCPCCKGDVYSFENHYSCINAKAIASKEASCKFKISTEILKQEISATQLKLLIEDGKTDLLTGFISQRTNKAFSAKLAWDKKQNRSVFEFEPRKEKPQKHK